MLVRSKPGRFIGTQKSRVIKMRIFGFIGFIFVTVGAASFVGLDRSDMLQLYIGFTRSYVRGAKIQDRGCA